MTLIHLCLKVSNSTLNSSIMPKCEQLSGKKKYDFYDFVLIKLIKRMKFTNNEGLGDLVLLMSHRSRVIYVVI